MSAVTMDSFLEVLKKSGLIPESRLQDRLTEWDRQVNPPTDLQGLARAFIEAGDITAWQAEKLINGKHKGFFLGKYKLLRLLGRGGMSAVYLAEHTLMKRRCAIKVLPTNRVNDSSYLARFHLEAQAAAALDDPHIVRAYDVDHFVDGKTEVHFLVMEYVEGRNLHDLVMQDGILSPLDAAEFVRQAAVGLSHAHSAGLVHRDIKPGNLLLDLKGTVKILDMGLARFFETGDDHSLTIQHDERVLGTADFLSPEQAINSHNVDARADIYSLGCTLYFLLTKHAPFEQGSLAQRLMAHQTQTPPPISQYRDDVPETLLAILDRMMAKKADDRYQTALENSSALKSWISQNADQAWLARHSKHWGDNRSHSGSPGSAEISEPTPVELVEEETDRTSADEFGDFLNMIGKESELSPSSGFSVADSATHKSGSSGKGSSAGSTKSGKNKGNTAGNSPDSQSILVGNSGIRPKSGSRTKPNSSGSSKRIPDDSIPAWATDQSPKQPEKQGEKPAHVKHQDSANPPFSTSLFTDTPPPASVASEDLTSSLNEESPASASSLEPSSIQQSQTSKKKQSELVSKLKLQTQTLLDKVRQKPLIWGGAALGMAVLISAGIYFSTPKSAPSSGQTLSENTTQQAENSGEKTGDNSQTPPPKMQDIGAEITVGPEGIFPTLSQAVNYLLNQSEPFSSLNEETVGRVIKIKSGVVIAEPLKILDPPHNFPKNLQIQGEGETPLVWNANGSESLIQLKNVEGLKLVNLQLNAAGIETAVQIEGRCRGLTLQNCFINDFSVSGIKLVGTAGLHSSPFRLDQVSFRTDKSSASGIQITPGLNNAEGISIERCRFLGPMSAGVSCTTDVLRWVTIKECQFHNLSAGIHISAAEPILETLNISNNTFHDCGTGIRIHQFPVSRYSLSLSLKRNLFVNSGQADFLVEQATQTEEFNEMVKSVQQAASGNWTTRSAPSESGSLNLFANSGKVEAKEMNLESTDPYAPNFLKPAGGAGKQPAASGLRPYVGSVSP